MGPYTKWVISVKYGLSTLYNVTHTKVQLEWFTHPFIEIKNTIEMSAVSNASKRIVWSFQNTLNPMAGVEIERNVVINHIREIRMGIKMHVLNIVS
jgi:hypothetical protein